MNQMIEQLQREAGVTGTSSAGLREALRERIKELASQCFFGFDINPDLVKATKMNMVMNNDGAGNILRQDSLLHPHQWDTDFKKNLANALGLNHREIRQPEDLALFDVIATNPPFGSKLPINDRETLSQYELGHEWEVAARGWEPTDRLKGLLRRRFFLSSAAGNS